MNESRIGYKPCVVCGKQYKICRTCEEAQLNGSVFWRASCDTRECFQVLLVVNDFYYNKMTKKEARIHLDNLLNDIMLPYTDEVKNLVEQIYHDDEIVEIVEQTVQSVDEEVQESNLEQSDILYIPEFNASDIDEQPEQDSEDVK